MPVFLFTPCGLGGGRTAPGGSKDSCLCASSFSWLGSGHLILISRRRNASLSITFWVACPLRVTGLSLNFTWKWKVSARRNLKALQTLIVEPFRAALRSQKRLRGGCAFGTAVCVSRVLNYLTLNTAPNVQYWIADLSGVKTFFFRGQKTPLLCNKSNTGESSVDNPGSCHWRSRKRCFLSGCRVARVSLLSFYSSWSSVAQVSFDVIWSHIFVSFEHFKQNVKATKNTHFLNISHLL